MNTLNNYQKTLDNAKRFAKSHKIDLSIYDFRMLDERGFNCDFTWNPKSKKMPKAMYDRDFFTNKRKKKYIVYIQLSGGCKSICSMTCYAKETVLDKFKEVKIQKKKERAEKKRIKAIDDEFTAKRGREVEKIYGCSLGRLSMLSYKRVNKIKEIVNEPGID